MSKIAKLNTHIGANIRYLANRRAVERDLAGRMRTLAIETVNICNANCIFCAYQYQTRPTGVMDMALYRKIIDEFCALGGGNVGLTPTVGDPLADPRLPERIAYARSKPEITSIGMHTNMISLRRFGADALINAGLGALTVSCSGFERSMYERVYRSSRYEVVRANIEAFARANNARGKPVDLTLELRADRPESEVRAYPDHRRIAELIGEGKILVKLRYDNWGGKITADQLSGTMRLRDEDWASTLFSLTSRARLSACSEFYSGLMVYWNGVVGACGCRDVDARELVVGDANTQHLSEIWFGAELAKLREDFLSEHANPLCRKCTHYNNMSIYLR